MALDLSPIRERFRVEEIEDAVLILGDCLEVMPLLGKVDAVVTDPPYGIGLENHGKGKTRRYMDWTIAGDDSQVVGQAAIDIIDAWGSVCIAFASPKKPWSGKWRQYLVWEKGEHVSGGGDPSTCWKPSWELVQIARNGPLNGRRDGAVLRFPARQADYSLHPTPKPISLINYLIVKTIDTATTILDPFMGSGTTGVACAKLGRKFIGIELDEGYFDIACKRIDEAYRQGDMFVERPTEKPVQTNIFDEATG